MDLHQPAWHPVASSDELPFRHVFHGQLLGQEMAVWRADDGKPLPMMWRGLLACRNRL